MSAEPYRSDEEVLEVLRGFETCETAPDDFGHRAHLVVALCYVLREPEQQALAMMRERLLKFLAHHRIEASSVYHETLTVFWIKRVAAFAARAGRGRALASLANELCEVCGGSRLVSEYYSKELVESDAARRAWVAPNLKPLDF